jgi:hypothetical protein
MTQPKPPAKSADKVASDDLPDPTRPTLWASAVYAVATMLLAYPALGGRILFNVHSDQYLLGYAFRDFAAQSLRAGNGFPQWNPYVQGGLPYVGAMHGDIFYPTFLLRMIMPTAVAMTWEFAIHLFLAGLFTFLFLRAWRLGFYAALIGGLAYMLSGSIAGFASPGHDGKLFVSALMPLALHLLTRGIRDGRHWAWGAFAIVIGLATLSPHPQLLQYLLLTSGCFALYLAVATHDAAGRLATVVAVKRLALAAGGVAVGLLIGAIQFAPALAYKPWSPRAAGHDWETATSYSFPIEETFNAYLPQFSGILDKYWGQNGIHFHSDYFGVVVLVLLGAAFGQSGGKSFKRFWIGAGLVALFWAYGGHTPLYNLILYVPYTKYLRAPGTIVYITAFAVAVLSAIGAERVLTRRVSSRYAVGWAIAGGLIAVFFTVGGYRLLVNLALGVIGTNFDPSVRAQAIEYFRYAERADANASSALLGAWRSFLFVGLTAGVIWGFVTSRLGQKTAAIALAALITVDLWSIERLYWPFSPPASITFASDPAVDAIKADIAKSGEPGRTLVLKLGQGIEPTDPAFRSRALMGHSVRTVEGNQGNELGIYRRMMQLDSGRVELRPTFWRHENVRYIYTGADEALMGQASTQMGLPAFAKLAGPVRNAAGSMVYSFRIPAPNPAAWVAGGAVSAPPDQVLPTVLDPRFDPMRAVLIDTGATIPTRSVSAVTPATVSAHVARYEPGRISIDLSAPAPDGAVLVVSENYYPGWGATAGAAPLQTSRANYNLIGVGLTTGTRHVDLSFTDPSYGRGTLMTLVALLLAIVGLIGGLVIDRRHAAAPTSA